MSLYPTNTTEEAVQVALGALYTEVAADERQPERIAGSISTLIARWCRLERSSPYRREAVEEALRVVSGIVDAGLVELVEERAQLALLLARQEIGFRVSQGRSRLSYSVREAAERCSMAPSYLSELEGGRSGMPAESTCARLEATLEIEIADLAREARAGVAEARKMRRVRRARSPSAPIGMDPRLAAAMAALARDRQLLELVEDAEQLTPGAKAALGRLARDLAAA